MPTLQLEDDVRQQLGLLHIAGLDEAGRGALAGPVVAAAVILPLDDLPRCLLLHEVNDSKQLSAATRERLFPAIIDVALTVGIGSAPASFVDAHGIIAATKLAMQIALGQLQPAARYLLIDGRLRLRSVPIPQAAIVRGDSHSLSIAAASILAKVTRDCMMVELDARFPGYGFAQHKGYGTLRHRQALERLGPTPEHRLSFAPLRLSLI